MSDNDETYLEEPPDTPAPLFAVKAIRSALFGTPHPDLNQTSTSMAPDHNSSTKRAVAPSESSKPLKSSTSSSREAEANLNLNPIASPTKGILITPGAGTTRRKNVSFSELAFKETKEQNSCDKVGLMHGKNPFSQPDLNFPPIKQTRQTNLTKALYKAKLDGSKHGLDETLIKDIAAKDVNPAVSESLPAVKPEIREAITDLPADITVDLNKPFSRSGQHWKAEFEQYHKKSDREMKKIIKYGQSIKSYAVKKDSEVSNLGEKLQQELAKVATMEAKVTDLAAQLASARIDNPMETSDQVRLVNDLTRQTALAIRFKQKADRYKLALKNQDAIDNAESGVTGSALTPVLEGIPSELLTNLDKTKEKVQGVASLRSELENCRHAAEVAESKAARLEAENTALKNTIMKMKEEMVCYEIRCLARENELPRAKDVRNISKSGCDAKSARFASENEYSLLKVGQQVKRQDQLKNKDVQPRENREIVKDACTDIETENTKPLGMKEITLLPKPAARHRRRVSHVDIWTAAEADSTVPSEKYIRNICSDSAPDGNPNILKEIHQNSKTEKDVHKMQSLSHVSINSPKSPGLDIPFPPHPDFPSCIPSALPTPKRFKSSATKRMRERRSANYSPRPSMLSFVSSPQKPQLSAVICEQPCTNPQASIPNPGNLVAPEPNKDNPTSLASLHLRSSVGGAGKGRSALKNDRIAAVKARLQERREIARVKRRGNG